jgi:ABC-2 type transport system ATP-binding protein
MHVIVADTISKSFGSLRAVDGISFTLDSGEILGLIGPNGAGKTTTIRMLLDIFKPDSGSISVFGQSMNEAMKDQVGYLPEERGLYQDISLEKCLRYLASIKGMPEDLIEERLDQYLERFQLTDSRKKKVKELSKGTQQKAQIIATFIHQPKLVIVDEPFSALDPVNTQMVKDLLREEKARGTAIMLSTHQMNQAEELCDRILLVNKGRIMLHGTLEEIRRHLPSRKFWSGAAIHCRPPSRASLPFSGRTITPA